MQLTGGQTHPRPCRSHERELTAAGCAGRESGTAERVAPGREQNVPVRPTACAAPRSTPLGTRTPIRPGSDNLPPLHSTTSNRRTDPPIGTRAIRARATPRTGRIRILVLPARNQPRAAPLAHLLDEQREAEPNALANDPRAGHLELGHRQVELLELARRDPQLQCPIQRFNVRFPDGRQRHNPPPLRMRREHPPDGTWSSPRTDTPASTPAAATGPQPLRPAACRTPERARGPRRP